MEYRVKILNRIIKTGFILLAVVMMSGITKEAAAAGQISISSASELTKIGCDKAYPMDGDYILEKDIDLSGVEWETIGGSGSTDGYKDYIGVRGDCNTASANVFSGTFDGNGHVISGMSIKVSGKVNAGDRNCGQLGLFSIIASDKSDDYAIVKNIIMSDVNIKVDFTDGFASVGALAGEVNGYALIDNITITNGTIIANQSSACDTVGIGGVIGECRTASSIGNGKIKVTNVYNGADVVASGTRHDYMYAGGIIGRIAKSKMGSVKSCLNVGTIMYDGFLAYAVTSPELGNEDLLSNIAKCYYLENSSKTQKSEAVCWSYDNLVRGMLPNGFDTNVWKAQKGSYPVPSICCDSSAADIVLFAGLEAEYATGDSKTHVTSEIKLPQNLGEMKLIWSTNNTDMLRIEGDKAIPATDIIGADSEVILTATTESGRSKDFKLTIIPDTYINAHFESEYAEVGKALKVVIDGSLDTELTYTWFVDGVKKDAITDTYIPSSDDLESFITVTVKAHNPDMKWELTTYLSELPVIYINTDDGNPVISNYITKNAAIKVQGNSEFSDSSTFYEGQTTIKGRGNSTWSEAVSMGVKKPYKLKLASKANLLGLGKVGNGKNKHWVLLANMIDHTNMRNEITYDFSRDMGLDCAMSSTGVVLILNGEYEGMYQLCEHVRVGDSRVNVYDWEGLAEDVAEAICKDNILLNQDMLEENLMKDLSFVTTGVINFGGQIYKVKDYYKKTIPDITGGYLLGMDFRSPYDTDKYPSSFKSSNTIPMYVDTPEYAKSCPEMMNYISGYINSFENAIKGTDYLCDYEGLEQHYSDLFDLDSLVNYWFVCELTNNWDSMKNSTYMYKDINGKIYMGPAWDYDWGYGNICMYNCGSLCNYTQWQTELSGTDTSKGGFAEQTYQKYQWNRYLVKDPYFVLKLYQKYKNTRNTVFEDLIKDNGVIDTLAKKYASASKANDSKWGFSYDKYKGYALVDGKKVYTTSQFYDDAVESFKTFVEKRINWFDKQFVDFDTLYASLGNKKTQVASVSVDTENTDSSDKVIANVTVNDNAASYVEIIINGRRVETQSGDYLYNITDGKARVDVPNYYMNKDEKDNIVQAVWYTSDYRLTDKDICYSVFEYNKNDITQPLPTKTPRPSGEPAPTKYPFSVPTAKPTRRPAATPNPTIEPVVSNTPAPKEDTSENTTVNNVTSGSDYVQPSAIPVTKDDTVIKKPKVRFIIKGKQVVRCNKSIKISVKVKGVTGKIKWKVNPKAKKYIKLNRKTGNSVRVKAGNKKGTYVLYVSCKSYKKLVKIKVKE